MRPRHLLVCGDSTLTRAILLELARRSWEQAELVKAAEEGRALVAFPLHALEMAAKFADQAVRVEGPGAEE